MPNSLSSHVVIVHHPATGRYSCYFGFGAETAHDRRELLKNTFPDLDIYVASIVSTHHGKRS